MLAGAYQACAAGAPGSCIEALKGCLSDDETVSYCLPFQLLCCAVRSEFRNRVVRFLVTSGAEATTFALSHLGGRRRYWESTGGAHFDSACTLSLAVFTAVWLALVAMDVLAVLRPPKAQAEGRGEEVPTASASAATDGE